MVESGKNSANKTNPSLACFIYDCLLSSCCDVAACCIILWEIWTVGKVLEERLSSAERPYTIAIYSDEVSPGNQEISSPSMLKQGSWRTTLATPWSNSCLRWSLLKLQQTRLHNQHRSWLLNYSFFGKRPRGARPTATWRFQQLHGCDRREKVAMVCAWSAPNDATNANAGTRVRSWCLAVRQGIPPRKCVLNKYALKHFWSKWKNFAISSAKMWYNDDTHLSPWLGWCIMTGATPRNIFIKGGLVGKLPTKTKVRASWK